MNAQNAPVPGPFTRTVLYAAYASIVLSVLMGTIYFGAWLSRPYVGALHWPELAGIGSGAMAVSLLLRHARLDSGRQGVLLTALGAGTIAALLSANMVVVAVIAWAVYPAFVAGFGGWVTAFLIAAILTAPALVGANRLIEGRLASDLPWKAWLRDNHFRTPTLLGLVIGLAAFFAARLSGISLESWLVEVFPRAQKLDFGGIVPSTLIVLTCGLTGPSDRRSALRSLLAALVVFESAVAGSITVAALKLALRSDSLWLSTAEVWLVAPVFVGAVLLVGRQKNAAEGQTQDSAAEEKPWT